MEHLAAPAAGPTGGLSFARKVDHLRELTAGAQRRPSTLPTVGDAVTHSTEGICRGAPKMLEVPGECRFRL